MIPLYIIYKIYLTLMQFGYLCYCMANHNIPFALSGFCLFCEERIRIFICFSIKPTFTKNVFLLLPETDSRFLVDE